MTETTNAWAEMRQALQDLDAMIQEGTNKNDRVDLLISASMEMGIVTLDCIDDAVSGCGYHRAHVLIRLAKNAGPDPVAKRWWRDEDDCYHNHPD